MKTLTKNVLSAFLIIGSIAMIGCKSKEKKDKPVKGEIEISMHCSGPEYFSDKKNIRSNALGESTDRSVAMKKGMNEAKTKLAASIQTTIKATIDNYANSREFNNKEQVEERFESLSREVVKQKLSNVHRICEKMTQKTDGSGKYVYYIAIEMKAGDLLEAINEKLTKQESLRIDYDYEKFKQTFDKEMNKLEKGY